MPPRSNALPAHFSGPFQSATVPWILRQAVLLRLIGLRQNVDDVRAAHAFGVIDPCLGAPVLFQSVHTRLGLAKKVFARAEAEAVRRASLDAGGLESHGDAVCTEGALVNLLCDWIQLGHVERTAGHAIA